MNVYVVTQSYPYSSTEMVTVYDSMDAVMHKMEMIRLHSMDEDEKISIECMEIINTEESLKRLNNVRKYKGETVES